MKVTNLDDELSSDTPSTFHKEPEAIDQYLKEIRSIKLLSKEEEQQLAWRITKGDTGAKDTMIKSNLRLVVKIARRYLKSGLQLLDLIAEGNIGLMRAVEKFNPEFGFRFSTYGAWWIQQNIERAIMNQARTVRLPVHVIKELNQYIRINKNFFHDNHTQKIAKALNKPLKNVEQALILNERPLSIDSSVSDEIDKPLLDILKQNPATEPENLFLKAELEETIKILLQRLGPKHREVIIRRYGLLGSEYKTLDETGKEIGLTRERVRQIQADALRRLKNMLQGQTDLLSSFEELE